MISVDMPKIVFSPCCFGGKTRTMIEWVSRIGWHLLRGPSYSVKRNGFVGKTNTRNKQLRKEFVDATNLGGSTTHNIGDCRRRDNGAPIFENDKNKGTRNPENVDGNDHHREVRFFQKPISWYSWCSMFLGNGNCCSNEMLNFRDCVWKNDVA